MLDKIIAYIQHVLGNSKITNTLTFTGGTGLVNLSTAGASTSQSYTVNASDATVNGTTGEVTLASVGQTVITAIKAADSTYAAATASYTLTVTNASQSAPSGIGKTNETAAGADTSITILTDLAGSGGSGGGGSGGGGSSSGSPITPQKKPTILLKTARLPLAVTAYKLADAKAAIGNRPAYTFTVKAANGKTVTNFGSGSVSISIPYILQKGAIAGGLHAVYVEHVVNTKTAEGWARNESGQWMYIQDGKRTTGKKTVDGKRYEFDQYGVTVALPHPERKYGVHTVQKGERFWTIARKYKVSMFELAAVNGKSIFSMIYAGDKLKIPQK